GVRVPPSPPLQRIRSFSARLGDTVRYATRRNPLWSRAGSRTFSSVVESPPPRSTHARAGGNLGDDAVLERVERVGETVRRRTGDCSASIHRLLRHLEDTPFAQAPRFLGFDDEGREVLSWISGDVRHSPVPQQCWSLASLTGAADMLRRYHDATTGFSACRN